MGRRIAIYAAVVILLTGIGLVFSWLLFGDEMAEFLGAESPGAGSTDRQATAPTTDNQEVADAVRDAGDDAGAGGAMVKVVDVKGNAERAVGDGQWEALTVGETLEVNEAIKTEKDGKVTLGVGENSTVEITEKAEIKVREITESVQKFKLIKGRIAVDYKEGGHRVLKVENADGSAVAQAEEGVFSVLATGTTVAVATTTGSVDLSAAGKKVTVTGGQQSVVQQGQAPSRPSAIPVDLMFRVVDPGCRVQRERYIDIRGRTEPGTAVTVNGTDARIEPDGRFSVRVPLRLGRNTVLVNSRDPSGRSELKKFPCITVDPGAPIKKVDIKWGAPAAGTGEES